MNFKFQDIAEKEKDKNKKKKYKNNTIRLQTSKIKDSEGEGNFMHFYLPTESEFKWLKFSHSK